MFLYSAAKSSRTLPEAINTKWKSEASHTHPPIEELS